METLGAARLAKEIPAQRAIAAVVPRDEITAVLQDPDGSPELSLRIATEETGEPSVIAMTWSRNELAQVLEREKGEKVILTFDRDELYDAIGDVEAHGLRERALVFAVAATGALGTGAAIANAMPTSDDPGAVPAAVAPVVSTPDSITDVSSAGGYTSPVAAATSVAGTTVSDAASGSGYAAPATATSAADTMVSDAASGAGYAPPAAQAESSVSPRMTDASSSGGYGTVESTGSSGEFLGIDQSGAVDGLIAGGVLLAIAGATFAARRTETPRPA